MASLFSNRDEFIRELRNIVKPHYGDCETHYVLAVDPNIFSLADAFLEALLKNVRTVLEEDGDISDIGFGGEDVVVVGVIFTEDGPLLRDVLQFNLEYYGDDESQFLHIDDFARTLGGICSTD